MLTALLPIPKFIHKNKCMHGVLEDRLIHKCLDIVLEPIKKAAEFGVMLPDPQGYLHYCFTPIAGYIVDTLEAAMLACIGGKTSPMTMVMYKQFRVGDPFCHEPRTAATTLAQIAVAKSKADPADLEVFFQEAQRFRLNGVSEPFWRNAPLSCPSAFITPELLHHLHKEFWDHDVQWCLNIIGEAEVDFRFSVLQPTAGSRHFKGGISKLKQVTGRVHREVQRYLVAIIGITAPSEVIAAVRALMDFRYRVQAYRISDTDLTLISAALDDFHANKHAILEHGGRRGKGKKVIDNWYIPKLELMQSIVPSIKRVGATIQWTADTTEHAHVSEIKTPAGSTNNNNYDPQICRYLDRAEKCRAFDLVTSLREQQNSQNQCSGYSDNEGSEHQESDNSDDDQYDKDDASQPRGPEPPGITSSVTDYFAIAARLSTKELGSVPYPLRSFTTGSTTVNLAYSPSLRRISIDEVTQKFGLPDLRLAIADFLWREAMYGANFVHPIGGHRRAQTYPNLPFSDLQVWFKIRLQNKPIHGNADVLPAQTLFCSPPSNNTWSSGRYNAAIFNIEEHSRWPESGLRGMRGTDNVTESTVF